MLRILFLISFVMLMSPRSDAEELVTENANATTELSVPDPTQAHRRTLELGRHVGEVPMIGPLPSILRAMVGDQRCEFGFNPDATKAIVYLPEKTENTVIEFLVAERSGLLADGTFVFSALDSKVIGNQAKLETHPGNHRIGYWGKASDYVTWTESVPAGDYHAELVYSRANPTGTKMQIEIGDKAFPLALESTGSWYRYRVIDLGDVTIAGESTTANVRVEKIVNGGVMNLKAIILTPKTSTAE
jgi:hypothetical protein